MADYTLTVEPRTVVGKKVGQLRRAGLVPATIYGPKTQPLNIQVPYRALEVTLMKAGGTHVIELMVGDTPYRVLTRHVQRDVVRGTMIHVDFFAIDAKSVIRAEVPVRLVNDSPAVQARQGILLTGPNTITIETLPDKLIDLIEIDLSKLARVGDAVLVSDLSLPDGIVIINDPDEMIVRVGQTSGARAALLEEMDQETAMSEPEVIQRGKAEDED
ncbi:MAG: 50S ribosomal protein L25/general stress protein Ctc [Anaerolineae bacterium]